MFCTKCGNELKDGDLFCGKCGTRVTAELAQEHVGASVDEGGNVQREEKNACDEQKKTASSPTRPRRRLPGKGLRKDLKLPPKKSVTVTSAMRVGELLGASATHDFVTGEDDPAGECLGAGVGCLPWPLVIINPFFIVALVCNSHAGEALKWGQLGEAKKHRKKRNLFIFLGLLSLPLEIWLVWKYIK